MPDEELLCREVGVVPCDVGEWNSLCLQQGNLLQSTLYDKVQEYFGLVPFYLEARRRGQLVGGVKVYLNRSKRLPWFYSSSLILGEVLVSGEVDEATRFKLLESLSSVAELWARREGVVAAVQSSFYGGSSLCLGHGAEISEWGIASVDLSVPEDTLLKNMHAKHRNMVNRAMKEGLIFEQLDALDDFLGLLRETYGEQPEKCPDLQYLSHHYKVLSREGVVRLYFVRDKEVPLAAAFVQTYGTVCDYTFAGGLKNNVGAGQYLQYRIFLEQKELGCSRYVLGQVANEEDADNLKFSCGITRFKTRFGVQVAQGRKSRKVRKPWTEKIWIAMNDLRKRK